MKAQNYKTLRNKEVFFNEFFSEEKLMSIITKTFGDDFTNPSVQSSFYDVFENCSFLATSYEYDRLCLGSDELDLHAACMLKKFMC